MQIDFREKASLPILNKLSEHTLAATLCMKFTEIGAAYLKCTMPVIPATHQPYGLLHGGASAALAETIGSVASYLLINRDTQKCVGIEINCNHVKAKRNGIVTATVMPFHIGRSLHVWNIEIRDEGENLICISRLTVSVITQKEDKKVMT